VSIEPSLSERGEAAETIRPLRLGVCLSGGQAPGGHNVIAGVFDFIRRYSKDSVLVGFMDGPHGIFSGRYTILDDDIINHYRNSGGFDIIGSGRHKIESPTHFASAMANCAALQLDGLVIIGGDDSNTNAAVLAEYFEANGCKTKVDGQTINIRLCVYFYQYFI
jgi:6-phosphofructokinase